MRTDRSSKVWRCVRLVVMGFACALVMSCLPLSRSSENTGSEPQESQIVTGRVIYKSPGESFSAVFSWKSTESSYELRLRDRLGLRRVRIEGTNDSAKIETSRGESLEDVDLQLWLEDQFGISIPILELPNCMTMDCSMVRSGRNHQYDTYNRLVQFEYDSWTVKATYDSRVMEESNSVNELQLLNGETVVRMIFDN